MEGNRVRSHSRQLFPRRWQRIALATISLVMVCLLSVLQRPGLLELSREAEALRG